MAAGTEQRCKPLRDPRWCTTHYEPSVGESFHQHHLPGLWGVGEEHIAVGLSRFDSEQESASRVELLCEAPVSLDRGQVAEFAGRLLLASALNDERAGTSRPALYLRCAYESMRAFAAAVRSVRACSPRADSSHSRSMIPE